MPANELGFFQKHTEKIALGLGIAVLAAAGATQFLLGEPNAVTINGKPVGPGEISDEVRKRVATLQNKLSSSEKPFEAFVPPAYTEGFAKLYDLPVAADGLLPAVIGPGGLEGKLAVVDSPDYPVKVVPSPPIATDLIVKAGNGVLAEATNAAERQQTDALRPVIGDHRPADFPYVSVRGRFSTADYRERYEAAGSNEADRIDPSLWNRRMVVAGVYLGRERWDPSTGKWVEARFIRPLPGQFGILPEDRPQLAAEEADGLEQEIQARQAEIRRLPFPRLANGDWTPPSAENRIYTAEEKEQKEDLERELVNLRRRLDRLANPGGERGARRTGGSTRQTRGGDGDARGGDQYGNDDLDDGDGAAPVRSRRRGSTSRAEREREQNLRRIETLQAQIQEKQTELNNLKGVDDADLGAGGGAGYGAGAGYGSYGGFQDDFDEDDEDDTYGNSYGRRATAGAGRIDDSQDELRVWAHDLTCKAGETYRYKLVVSMFNPLYRQNRLTRKQLKENYDRVAIGPDEAELIQAPWSPAVTLAPKFFYFATSGNKDEKRAEFEVWTIHNGVWEMSAFPEVPGNEIGGLAPTAAPGGVQMAVGKILLDVDAVSNSVVGGSTQIRTLVLDQASGQIEGRLVSEDRRSDQREKLLAAREEQIRLRDGVRGPTARIDDR